ncbi:MAG: penicillin acylase family protein [Alphaproteobacteria bacterium]
MRGTIKWLGRIFLGLTVLILVAGVGGYFVLRSSLPKTDGMVVVQGLEKPVEIIRDSNGIPHIFASNDRDASFALGYVHAQDRLLQMELMRRFGAGRLAEIVGAPALGVDRVSRTLGLYRLAEASLANLQPQTRAGLKAYAAGVNAYLATHEGVLPPSFHLLGFKPEPWRPADSLVWGRIMATRLAFNWRRELLRAYFAKKLGADKIAALWPPAPKQAPYSLAGGNGKRSHYFDAPGVGSILAAIPRNFGTGASNAWALSGARTRTGKPILANDPHLQIGAPILWYLAHIETPAGKIIGATVPGVPTVIVGHNGNIAWGFTTTYADTDDVFIERIDPKSPGKYLTANGPRPFKTRVETIRVKSAKAVRLVIRETHHGPVLNGMLDKRALAAIPAGQVLALSAPWLRRNDTTPDALYALNRAHNWSQFTAALRRWVAPPQNITYADIGGTIGLFTPGLIPIRKKGEGYLPVPGWSGKYDWERFIPFAELPFVKNPVSGRVVNANNRLVGPDYPHFISREWGHHYRASRISRLLAKTPKHTIDTTVRIQGDRLSVMAADVLPLLLAAPVKGEAQNEAVRLLRSWNREMDRTRPEPLIFMTWFREVSRALYADELGTLFPRYFGMRPGVVRYMLTKDTSWCDDVKTPGKETCEQRIALALDRALVDLRKRHGGKLADLRWGEAHYADFRHPVLNFVPVLKRLANLRIPSNGGRFTVNKASPRIGDAKAPFAQRAGPGFRAIYDLANLDRSRFIIATGQSGNPLSRHYGDFVDRWRDIRYVKIAGTRAQLRGQASGILILNPSNGKN